MRLRQRIGQYFHKRFPKKAAAMEEFAELVQESGVTSIDITLAVEPERGVMTGAVGIIAEFRHDIKYTGNAPKGRPVVYKESCSSFGSEYGAADAKDRRKVYLQHHLIAKYRREQLLTQLPHLSIMIFSPRGEILDDAFFASLHEEAVAMGLYD